jgi:hypothetical protein
MFLFEHRNLILLSFKRLLFLLFLLQPLEMDAELVGEGLLVDLVLADKSTFSG